MDALCVGEGSKPRIVATLQFLQPANDSSKGPNPRVVCSNQTCQDSDKLNKLESCWKVLVSLFGLLGTGLEVSALDLK